MAVAAIHLPNKESIVNFLYSVYWWISWVILLVGMSAIIRYARGYISGKVYDGVDRGLMAGFTGLLDLQAVTGLIFFLWSGVSGPGFSVYRVPHGVVMFFTVVIPHLSALWKHTDDRTRYLNNFYLLLTSFLLMLVGLALIP